MYMQLNWVNCHCFYYYAEGINVPVHVILALFSYATKQGLPIYKEPAHSLLTQAKFRWDQNLHLAF